jgi:hypothetical protein
LHVRTKKKKPAVFCGGLSKSKFEFEFRILPVAPQHGYGDDGADDVLRRTLLIRYHKPRTFAFAIQQ